MESIEIQMKGINIGNSNLNWLSPPPLLENSFCKFHREDENEGGNHVNSKASEGSIENLNWNPIEEYAKLSLKQNNNINNNNTLGPPSLVSPSSPNFAPKVLQKSVSYPCRYDISMDFDVTNKRLGDGASCVVYEGVQRSTGKSVAVKTIPQMFLLKEPSLLNEIKILSRLNHPNIVRILAASNHKGSNVAIVMELLSGDNLFDHLCEINCFTESQARNIFKQILSASCYLHQNGIVHRDIKPENIVFTDLTCDTVKLIDFGLASKVEDIKSFPSSISVGTLGYKSPEVLNHSSYSNLSDCWSLGVLLYIMLCGYPPFLSSKDDVNNEDRLTNCPFWVLFNRETGDLKEQISNSNVEFPPFSFSHVSDHAIDLITKLLSPLHMRISSSEAIKHPWFSSEESA